MQTNILKPHLSKVPEAPKKIVPEKKIPAAVPKKEKGILASLYSFLHNGCLFHLKLIWSSNLCNINKKIVCLCLRFSTLCAWLCCLISFKCQKSQRSQFQKKGLLQKWLRKKNLLQPKVNEIAQHKNENRILSFILSLLSLAPTLDRGVIGVCRRQWCIIALSMGGVLFVVMFIGVYVVNCHSLKSQYFLAKTNKQTNPLYVSNLTPKS